MENTNNEKKTLDTISVEYQGAILIITEQEYNDLRDGWVTMKDLGLA